MILPDYMIESLCQGIVPPEIRSFYSMLGYDLPAAVLPMIDPYDPSLLLPETLVNPASLDHVVGDGMASIQYQTGEWKQIDMSKFSKEKPYWMMPYPAERVLIPTLETFNLPRFIVGVFKLKSSRAREFYQHLFAGYEDPGWHGSKLTMELVNFNAQPLPLYPGLKMGQTSFSLTFGLPVRDYSVTGRYNGDTGAARSKG